MKRRAIVLVLAYVLCVMFLCSCSSNVGESLTYQDYFDLGVRYLSEGNYQEAIIAFTAAIEIEPKQALAYVKRGDAYVLSGKTEVNLESAKADYEKAIALDETNVEAYLDLAEVYIRQGNYEMALEVLKRGLEKGGHDQRIVSRLEEIENNSSYNEYGATEFTRRPTYQTFESLPEEQQLLIIEMAECAQSGDYDAMLQIVDKSVGEYNGGFTSWNGYKIEYRLPNQLDTDGSLRYYQITLRPENGMGYEVCVWLTTTDRIGGVENNISISSCPCSNWQWDGTYQYRWTVDAVYSDPSYPQSEMHHVYTETGAYVNGLRNGEFYKTSHSLWNYRKRGDVEHRDEEVDVYDMGICIQRAGDSVDNDPESISWNGGKVRGSLEDQWVLDALYW